MALRSENSNRTEVSYAGITGFLTHKSFLDGCPHLHSVAQIGAEELLFWRPKNSDYYNIIAKISGSRSDYFSNNIDIPAAIVLMLAEFIETTGESGRDWTSEYYRYQWIINFNPLESIETQTFENQHYRDALHSLRTGRSSTPQDLCRRLRFGEAFRCDRQLFHAALCLFAAMQSHYVCARCALSEDYQMHRHDPIQSWDFWHEIACIDSVIVQATRTIEYLVGKPNKSTDGDHSDRFRSRWCQRLDIELDHPMSIHPADAGDRSGMTNGEFYRLLFQFRNSSAHAHIRCTEQFMRANAVQSIAFAWQVFLSYLRKRHVYLVQIRDLE
jgi:hypothetical protein